LLGATAYTKTSVKGLNKQPCLLLELWVARNLLAGTCAIGSLLFGTPNAFAQRPLDKTELLLQALSDANGPTGFEGPVREILSRELDSTADELSYDGLGSLIARQGSAGPRIMLDAHMDEVGALVRRITPDGFLSMQMLGAWLDQALPDQRWLIIGANGPIEAVTGIRDIHAMATEDRSKPIARDSLFLDIGAKDAAEVAARGIRLGDPIVPLSPFSVVGKDRYLGKAWDDRIGCAVLVEVMRRLKATGHDNQLFAAATVQEEVGSRGASTAVEVIRPDVGIAIEAGIVGDTPSTRNAEEAHIALGNGPGVFLYNSVEIPNRKLVRLVADVAKAAKVPLQYDLVQNYGDDSAAIQRSGTGVPTINLVVPVRSTHAHNGVVDRSDFENTVKLVVALITHLDAKTVKDLHAFDSGEDLR
jgi:putative aminopeptidase FrvX